MGKGPGADLTQAAELEALSSRLHGRSAEDENSSLGNNAGFEELGSTANANDDDDAASDITGTLEEPPPLPEEPPTGGGSEEPPPTAGGGGHATPSPQSESDGEASC